MATASSASNGAPTAGTLCSEKHCGRLLGFSKGNLCHQCTAKMRSHDNTSTKGSEPVGILEGPGAKRLINVDNDGTSPAPLVVPEAPEDLPLGLSLVDSSASNTAQTHLPQAKRPSFAIPYQTQRVPRGPNVAVSADSNKLPARHFNSRGEIIGLTRFGVGARIPRISRNTETYRTGASSERHGKMTQCGRCNCLMPGYHLGDICPTCRVDMTIVQTRGAGNTGLITPVNAQTIVPTSFTIPSSSRPLDNPGNLLTTPQNDIQDDGDVDAENLELTYPTNPNVNGIEAESEMDVDAEPINPVAGPSSSPPDQLRPAKRQKSSRSERAANSKPSQEKARKIIEPLFKDVKSTPFRSLKLCSTPSCTGIISADSFATRCLTCVRSDWKCKRSKLSARIKQVDNSTTSNGISRGENERDLAFLKQRKDRKVVTWADELSDTTVEDVENIDSAISSDNTSALNEVAVLTTAVTFLHESMDSKGFLPSEIEPLVQSDVGNPTPMVNKSLSQQNSPCSPPQKSAPKVRLIVNPSISDSTVESSSHGQPFKSASGLKPPNLDQTNPSPSLQEQKQSFGWDSDLTELSDSTDDADSTCDSSGESELNVGSASTSSGLKIRIPPRPGGVYSRKCASPRCDQVLAAKYRWKSCVMCRAQSRDYQRKRQNIQGRHTRLDQEFLEAQNMGTPLAGDLHKQDNLIEEDTVVLIPGARLCSIRNCTYIIPPVEEYRWKMCALCRLRRRENKKQDRLKHGLKGSADRMTTTLMLQNTIKNLPLRSGPCSPGRCRSIDCGMLVVDAKASQCKQCIARRLWLTSRSGSNMRGIVLRRQYAPKPQRPSPYPQFKCFSAFLLEFKSRLGGFVKAHSVFYLFRQITNAKALFAFDGEFSIVSLDNDLIKRKDEVDSQAMNYKREIEHIGRIKFNSKRLISILEGGGIAIRFVCLYTVPILQATRYNNKAIITTVPRDMQCELEIANVPDNSHPFIPGQRTIIRFRLLG